MKKCSTCKIEKPFSEFHKHKNTVDGYKYNCKKCRSSLAKKSSNVSKKNKAKKWYRALFNDCKKRAKNKNYKLDFDYNFILELYEKQDKKCYWYNIEMKPSSKPKYPFQPSIDRIDNTKGYSKDNIVLCCFSANMGRNTNDHDTFKEFAEVIKGLKNEPIQEDFSIDDKREKEVIGPNNLYFSTVKDAADYKGMEPSNFKRFVKSNKEWTIRVKNVS